MFHDKGFILAALARRDIPLLREISRYFYRTSGIYQKVVNTFATMYRYDWYVTTENVTDSANSKNVVADCLKVLSTFEYEVFKLKLKNYSYKEIAKILNVEVKKVDNALLRIKNKLIKYK